MILEFHDIFFHSFALIQTLKKEMPMGNAKNSFYNNFETQNSRRDISAEQFSMPPSLVTIQATPSPPVSNNSAIHNSNFGPTQIVMKQNANNAKNRFPNANAGDVYYGSGYFGKQGGNNSGADYYGKYDAEFGGHQQHQKGVVPPNVQIAPFAQQQSKVDFVEAKPPNDFHHVVKGEIHHNIKPEFIQQQQQQHHKTVEFHHGKAGPPPPPPPPNFHLNHQNFYNHHGPHAANVDGVHQQAAASMQYNANQYFPNEYGGANDLDASAAYYEHKAASAQQTYYENMYNSSGNNPSAAAAAAAAAAEFHASSAAYGASSNGQLPNEHCDSFLYPQYFEGGNHHEPNVTVSMQAQAQIHNHIAPGHNLTHQNQHYNHGIGNPHYQAQQHANGHPHIAGSPMDNSNSSSDFNFLSNIANDFAPEYYQLS